MKPFQKIGLLLGISYLFFSMRKPAFASPVKKFTLRDCDAAGCGHFKASRIRNGVSVPEAHNGIDIVVVPGEEVFAPMSGVVRTLFVNPNSTDMKGVEITNGNKEMKIFYFAPDDLVTGETIVEGEYMGTAQNVADYYGSSSMRPHLHVELRIDGELVDPTPYFA